MFLKETVCERCGAPMGVRRISQELFEQLDGPKQAELFEHLDDEVPPHFIREDYEVVLVPGTCRGCWVA